MKEGWTYKKLGEVANIVHGKNQKEVISENGQYPIYGSGGNVMGYAKDYLCEAGTTILGRKGSINNPQYIEERFWNVDTAFGISAKPGNDNKFIYYFVKRIDWSEKNTGTTLPSLTQQVVKSVAIPVPSLAEQRFIVSRLDAAFAGIDALKANAERQLAEARALFSRALTEEMRPKEGWNYKKLGDVCDAINGLWKGKKGPFVKVGVIRNANFTKNFTLRFDNVEYLDVEERQYAKRKLQKGDLIIEKSGGSVKQPVGRAVLFNKVDGNYSFSNFTSVLRIIDKKELLSVFLFFYLLYVYKRGETLKMQKATTGIHNIEFDKYLNIDIPIIPLTEQHSIVARLDALSANVRKLEEVQRKTLLECDALKQALLKEVFE